MTPYSYARSQRPIGTRMLLAGWVGGCALAGVVITGVPFLLLRKAWHFNVPLLQLLVILIGSGMAASGAVTVANQLGRLEQRMKPLRASLATAVGVGVGSIAASATVGLYDDELWQFMLMLGGALLGAFMGVGEDRGSGSHGKSD